MYSEAKVCVFNTAVEPENSGTKTFKQSSNIVDINELHKCLLDSSKFVVISNDVSAYSDATEKQNFIVTDKLVAEEGYADTFVFSHFGKSLNTATPRRIVMSFTSFDADEPEIKATYSA